MICKNCNTEIPDDCIYCANCGTKLEKETTSDSQELIKSSENPKNSKKLIVVILSISAIIIILLITIIILLSGKNDNTESSKDAHTTIAQTQSTAEVTSTNESDSESSADDESNGDYAYESDYLYPTVDEYIAMLNNSDIVKVGAANYEINYYNDNPNSFKAELKVDYITIQTIAAGSPISEDDDNFGRITDVMAVTKNFAKSSSQNQDSSVLFGAAMTPIMPVLAPDKPLSYALTILNNHTKEYWANSNLHFYVGTQNDIPWVVIYKSDGTIATACGELSVEYLTKSFQ